jgi:DNA ligase-1
VNHLDLMHGRDYSGQRVGGWLCQEKLDGLRCLWTGAELVSRNGERFNAPAWFTAGLPVGIPLDGELYAGPGTLGRVSATLARHKSGADADWQGVRFMVFDAPASKEHFASRACELPFLFPFAKHAEAVRTFAVESIAKLRVALKHLHKSGGEGFMLREPSAPYVAGRTGKLLKFKSKSLY